MPLSQHCQHIREFGSRVHCAALGGAAQRARGASDDKGQMYMHVKAFESMMKTNSLPCNVKFMIEGEEEVGSDSLGPFLENNKEELYMGEIDNYGDRSGRGVMIDK